MRKFITTIIVSLSLIITGSVVYAVNISSTSHNKELIFTLDKVDQYLGMVNTCDLNGNTCRTMYAFKDSNNGRIYVAVGTCQDDNGNTIPNLNKVIIGYGSIFYAEKSNDSRWEYRIRISDWEYFNL